MPRNDTEALAEAIRDNLSPHAVSLIAAKLRPAYGRGELGHDAERECAWFADLLIGLVGEEYDELCDAMGL